MTKDGLQKLMAILEGAVGRRYPEYSIVAWAELLERTSDREGIEVAKEIAKSWPYGSLPALGVIFKGLGYVPGVGYSSQNRFTGGEFSTLDFELPEQNDA